MTANSTSQLFEKPMPSQVAPFKFEQHTVRTILRPNGELWFVAADVCKSLAIGNAIDATKRLDGSEKGFDIIETTSGQQSVLIINESGLYSLILTSRKPEAKRFKRWVTNELLPAIRNTGGYGTGQAAPALQVPATLSGAPMLAVQQTFGGNDAPPTMSSLEIESLTGSRHDNVKVAIERIAAKGAISLPAMQGVKVQRERRAETVDAYIFTGDKGRRDSIIVVAQLCPEFTARIVDRWQELECQLAQSASAPVALPDFTNPAAAARAWADQIEAKEQAQQQLAIAAPKAQALDRIAQADGDMCIRDAAKHIGTQPSKLTAWMEQNKWIYRRAGVSKPIAYQDRIQSGYLTHKVTTVQDRDGADKNVSQVIVTPKGLAKLAEVAA